MHKRLFGVEAKKVGGDTGYAGTENRDYCKANGIQTSFVNRGRPFGEKKGERPCPKGTCQSDGECDGRLVRDTERALRSPEGQGQDEADGNPVHLHRHPHGKRGAVGGQDRTKVAFGGCLTLKLAVNAELLWRNCILAMKNGQKIRPKQPETDIKLKF